MSILFGIVLICGLTLMALLRQPDPYPFVAGAAVVRLHEYIQDSPYGGSQFAHEGVYRFDQPIEQVASEVQKSLKSPKWKLTRNVPGKELKFDNEVGHVTLQSRQTGGTTLFIQEFRAASFSDRFRMWWKRHFNL